MTPKDAMLRTLESLRTCLKDSHKHPAASSGDNNSDKSNSNRQHNSSRQERSSSSPPFGSKTFLRLLPMGARDSPDLSSPMNIPRKVTTPNYYVVNLSPPNQEEDLTRGPNDVGKNYRVKQDCSKHEIHDIVVEESHVGMQSLSSSAGR